MSKRTKSADVRYMLDTILSHSLFHMHELEKQVEVLKLKMDGTDKPEDLQKARVLTLVLTILNDSIHPSHAYISKVFSKQVAEKYVKNQKLAFDNKLVNPCSCNDCKERGYVQHEVAMERTDNESKHTNVATTSELEN
jgi:hypothetical protein